MLSSTTLTLIMTLVSFTGIHRWTVGSFQFYQMSLKGHCWSFGSIINDLILSQIAKVLTLPEKWTTSDLEKFSEV